MRIASLPSRWTDRGLEDRALADHGIAVKELDASACITGQGFRCEVEAVAHGQQVGGAQGQADVGCEGSPQPAIPSVRPRTAPGSIGEIQQ